MKKMNIYINSTYREIPDNIDTIGKLLPYLKISKEGTGVGVNNKIALARNWDVTSIKEDDRIVIISATYGG